MIDNSYSTVSIEAQGTSTGGLVSYSRGEIEHSFATGSTNIQNGYYSGTLVATNDQGAILNSYATGAVTGTGGTTVGGFIGVDAGEVATEASYSIGHVSHQQGLLGGFTGDGEGGTYSDCYWDTQTSGTEQGTGEGNAAGLTGVMSKQLKKGRPEGFDPSIWAQNKKINNGFPYLIANPPPGTRRWRDRLGWIYCR